MKDKRHTHRRGCDKEATSDSSNRKSHELGGHHEHPIVYNKNDFRSGKTAENRRVNVFTGKTPSLLVENALGSYNICGISTGRANGCHYRN
jgi:hypothetical protein